MDEDIKAGRDEDGSGEAEQEDQDQVVHDEGLGADLAFGPLNAVIIVDLEGLVAALHGVHDNGAVVVVEDAPREIRENALSQWIIMSLSCAFKNESLTLDSASCELLIFNFFVAKIFHAQKNWQNNPLCLIVVVLLTIVLDSRTFVIHDPSHASGPEPRIVDDRVVGTFLVPVNALDHFGPS